MGFCPASIWGWQVVPWGGIFPLLPRRIPMKTCPFCRETDLQDDAVLCKHCRSDLSEAGIQRTDSAGVPVDAPVEPKSGVGGCAMTIAVILFIGGIFFWPLWIGAIAVLVLAYVVK